MAFRLRAAGADLARVHDVGDGFELPDSLPQLRVQLEAIPDLRLLVIDPLSAVSAVSLQANVTCRRNIVKPLQLLARDLT
jgi:hypothetical protein